MGKARISSIIALSFCILCACKTTQTTSVAWVPNQKTTIPKNIILMIGDGMGLTQVSAAMFEQNKPLNLERMPIIGLQKTFAKNDLVTDSAASATAMSRGIKTDINTFGSDDNITAPPSILERFEDKGYHTGLIVTSSITHATPAAFYTYAAARNLEEDIAIDLVESGIDLFIGGGQSYFDVRDNDDRNLIQEMKKDGYVIESHFHSDFLSIPANAEKYGYFMSNGEPLPVSNGRSGMTRYCKAGMEFLARKEKPFFLMIEGSQIDKGGHANRIDYVLHELYDFDKALGAVLDFADKDKETLVIVTADHETGGLTINQRIKKRIIYKFTTKMHTAAMVPVYAYGPGAEHFSGIYDNTALFEKMNYLLSAAEGDQSSITKKEPQP